MSLMATAGSGRESVWKQEKLVWALGRGINVWGARKSCSVVVLQSCGGCPKFEGPSKWQLNSLSKAPCFGGNAILNWGVNTFKDNFQMVAISILCSLFTESKSSEACIRLQLVHSPYFITLEFWSLGEELVVRANLKTIGLLLSVRSLYLYL